MDSVFPSANAAVFLFGDQTGDCRDSLRKALRRKGFPLVELFLDQVSIALRDEISRLPRKYRDRTPNFTSISDLVGQHRCSESLNLEIDSAITCITHFTHFICFLEHRDYLLWNEVSVLGVCTGLIASSIAASCLSLPSLIPLAVEAVRIALRLGFKVASIADQIEGLNGVQDTWASVVTGLTVEEVVVALAEFHKKNNVPEIKRIYISANSMGSITISGPPSILKHLYHESKVFQKAQRKDIHVRGPYHARHLYRPSDIDDILSGKSYSNQTIYPFISSTGVLVPPGTATWDVLRHSLREILMEPIQWAQAVKTCVSEVSGGHKYSCDVLPMGPTMLARGLASSLEDGRNLRVKVKDHLELWGNDNHATTSTKKMAHSKIAIVGMAGRFPNAADHEEFWKLLEDGLDVHREIPKDRFNAKAHTDPSGKGKNKSHTPYGCFIEDPGLFDARFFNMSPREATQTDPMQRLAIVTAYEAMEMAGFVPDRTPSSQKHRIATFYGQTSDDWRETNAAQDIDTYFITGGVRAFGPGRINYHFGFSGPSYSIDTACSSSFAAINLACTALRAGDCDTVFTGGVNVLTNPDIFSGLSKGQFLSKTGSCKTYDDTADGYCRGDGVVTLILKRLEDALADRDPILATICSIATNHSAEAISITHPHSGAQKRLFQKIMDDANVDAYKVDYVEMHGTGTEAGDSIEMESVSSIFAPRESQLRRRSDQPLYIGSVKANIGHGEAVSGASALVKAILMLEKNMIPPHCGVKTKINKEFPSDLDVRNVRIAFKPTPFNRPAVGRPRYIFLNNFSAAGGNTAMLLKEHIGGCEEPYKVPAQDPRSTHAVAVSAKSLSSFKRNISRLIDWTLKFPDANLSCLAYTTTARRSHYNYRVAIAVETIGSVREELISLSRAPCAPVSSTPPKIAFVFAGQGPQYIGMGKELFRHSNEFRLALKNYNRIANQQGLPTFLDYIIGNVSEQNSLCPVVTQLAITCIGMALSDLWKCWGFEPAIVVGHSLGEYAALYVAGVLSALDVVSLVGNRAKQMIQTCCMNSHDMLAVRGSVKRLEHCLRDVHVEVACVNGPDETVYSGSVDQIKRAADIIESHGMKCTRLQVPFAFHSSQVEPVLDAFEESAAQAMFHTPKIPIISPLLRNVITSPGVIGPNYLRNHCRNVVDFLGSLEAARKDCLLDSETVWVEIGPHPVCSGMIKAAFGKQTIVAPSLRRGEDAWATIAKSLSSLYNAGAHVGWSEYHRDFSDSLHPIRLPSYAFDEKVYWIDYKNNWCLAKGDMPTTEAPNPRLSTTSVQRIVLEEVHEDSAVVVAESDLTEPLLRAAISGHLVGGAGLCPSSLYADMALTISDYAYRSIRGSESDETGINVRNMETYKPLVVKLDSATLERHVLQIEAKIDLAGRTEINFRASSGSDTKFTDLAKCEISFESVARWAKEWQRINFLVKSRIEILQTSNRTHRVQRGMIYKLFATLVQYGNKYRGMEEVIIDSEQLEAISRVSFQATSKDGDFFQSPYFIDSLAHISGFTMNANDTLDSQKSVYINHGWESMQFAKKLDPKITYHSYVKMHFVPGSGQMAAGDVYVFQEGEIIGIVSGLKFQCVPRTLLDTFLGPAAGGGSRIQPSWVGPVFKQTKMPKLNDLKGLSDRSSSQLTPDLTRRALIIIAEEIGCSTSDLANQDHFADLGVDSLMSLAICDRFREELEISIQSTMFMDYPTIGHVKNYLKQFETDMNLASTQYSPSGDTSVDFTPDSKSEILEPEGEELSKIIRSTIASGMGLDVEEIAGSSDLSTMGMDSLMCLSILGALRERTGLSLSSNLLVENASIDRIEAALGIHTKLTVRPIPSSLSENAAASIDSFSDIVPLSSFPPARCVLLQGNPKTAKHNIFLLPDGSGSATSYTAIPELDPLSLCVYGLNCPFMRNPDDFIIGIRNVVRIYMAEIKRRQPMGPYIIGGWSVGGILAYEMTQQLLAQGDLISKLILIDCPFPIGLEALPTALHHFCAKIGLLGSGDQVSIPNWLLSHFAATTRQLTAYSESLEGRSFRTDNMPRTTIIWARDGLVKTKGDLSPDWDPSVRMPNSFQWLMENRADLGPNGWDKLVGTQNLTCVATGGNHFTMLKEPHVQTVGKFMKQALG